MARPHAQLTVEELTVLVKKHRGDVPVLRELDYELGQRTRAKAKALRDEVRDLLKDGSAWLPVDATHTPKRPTTTPTPADQRPLWPRPKTESSEELLERLERITEKLQRPPASAATIDTPKAQFTAPAASAQAEPYRPPKPTTVSEMSVDAARRILGAERSTPWEKLEATRREKVQKAHPEVLRGLAPQIAQALVDEAARINAAYACLMTERAKG